MAGRIGAAELARRQERAWASYLARCGESVTPMLATGRAAVESAYREVLDGRCVADHGHLLALR